MKNSASRHCRLLAIIAWSIAIATLIPRNYAIGGQPPSALNFQFPKDSNLASPQRNQSLSPRVKSSQNHLPSLDDDWQNIELVRTLKGHNGAIDSLVFSPDGKMLISGGSYNDGKIKLWWLKTGREIDSLRAHRTAVLALALSPDGQTLASCSDDAAINLWKWESGKYTRTFLANSNNTLSLAITPDSQNLVTGGLDGIRVWDLRTQRPLYTLVRFDNQTYGLAVNANGYIVASGNKSGVVKLWNLRTGKSIGSFVGHGGIVSTVAFTPDGRTLVTGSYDRTIRVWNLNTGKLAYTLSGHTGEVRAIAINPDGQILASASRDGVRLWNLRTGQLIAKLSGHSDWVESVAFSPDGSTLATGSLDKTINIWRINSYKPREYQAQL